MIWSAIERFSVQGVQFLVMIVMARLLMPEDYGLIGMLSIFIAVSQSLIDSGFAQALIRKQNRTDVDKSTVFFFNITVSCFIYGLLYIAAPFVSEFYNKQELCSVMRILCLVLILRSFSVVQNAVLTINVDFGTQAKASFSAAAVSGVIGIALAYKGYGVWSLVVQQLVVALLNSLLLWIFTKWRPILKFSKESFREMFSFGSKLMLSGLLHTIYNNLYTIVIGKLFSANSLGHYTRAQHFASFPSSNLTGILQRVSFPILCEIQDDDVRLAQVYRKFLNLSAFIIFPLMMLLAGIAKPMILFVIGQQWEFCSTLLTIICFDLMWHPVHAINLNLLQVKGRSDLFLRLEIIKKVQGIIVLCLAYPHGVVAMCCAQIFTSIMCLFINTYYTGKLIGVGFVRQMLDLLPTLILSVSMFVIVFFVKDLVSDLVCQLVIGLIVGTLYYVGATFLFKFRELSDIKSVIKKT